MRAPEDEARHERESALSCAAAVLLSFVALGALLILLVAVRTLVER